MGIFTFRKRRETAGSEGMNWTRSRLVVIVVETIGENHAGHIITTTLPTTHDFSTVYPQDDRQRMSDTWNISWTTLQQIVTKYLISVHSTTS